MRSRRVVADVPAVTFTLIPVVLRAAARAVPARYFLMTLTVNALLLPPLMTNALRAITLLWYLSRSVPAQRLPCEDGQVIFTTMVPSACSLSTLVLIRGQCFLCFLWPWPLPLPGSRTPVTNTRSGP